LPLKSGYGGEGKGKKSGFIIGPLRGGGEVGAEQMEAPRKRDAAEQGFG